MQIVAFAGMAKAGKSTAADSLAKTAFDAGWHVVVEQFAKPLKEASKMLGFVKGGPYDHLYREFCQFAGAKARASDPDWWVKKMASRLDILSAQEQHWLSSGKTPFHEILVIIDDLRFPNEVELLKKYSATTVFVDAYRRMEDRDADWRQHESEEMAHAYTKGQLSDELFDFTLVNNTSEEAMRQAVAKVQPIWCGEIAEEHK